jgi:hypothetical protein
MTEVSLMTRSLLGMAPALISSLFLSATPAAAGEPGQKESALAEVVPLDDGDRRAITLEILKAHPLLSASPGIKYAEASRGFQISGDAPVNVEPHDYATVIFRPHTETGGIKNAYEAQCERAVPSGAWSCPDVQIRRYVKLDSQDFEVRVKGDLDLEGVIAVIDATRELAQSSVWDGSGILDTATIVFPANGGYVVSWRNPERTDAKAVEAFLRNGGSPANPHDWQAQWRQSESR